MKRKVLSLIALAALVLLPAVSVVALTAEEWFDYGKNKFFMYGEDETAIECFTKAISLDPKFASAYSYRGWAYGNLGKYDLAIADCTRAIELDPKDANAYVNRGNAYSSLGKHDLAIADYTKAISLPNVMDFYNTVNSRGVSYEKLGNYDLAIADYRYACDNGED